MIDAACHLALGVGLRREEVLGLRWEDVSEDAVQVVQTLTAADGALHFGPPKSKAGARTLPLPGFVASALGLHRKAQAERLWPLGGRSELVIDNGLGQPYQPASFSGAWRTFAREHGFKGVTFHGLRHGAATLLLAASVPDAVAASIMGTPTRESSGDIRSWSTSSRETRRSGWTDCWAEHGLNG